MAIRNNPGTISSNLRFAYDIADVKNSYLGEPTTNLIAYSQPTNGVWNTNGAGVIITQNFGYSPIGTLNSSLVQDNQSSGNAPFCYYAASVSSNTIYTISVWVKPSKANTTWGLYIYEMSPNISFINNINFSALTPGVWTKVSLTVTTDSNATSFAPHILAGAGLASTDDTVEIWGVQVEQKDHSTTTIPTFGSTLSRSVTNSLFDISGYNASLDMSNVSFNSSGNPTFDGSNDYINVAHANSPITNRSYELIFNPTSIPASNTYRSIWQKSGNWNGDTGISMQFIYNNFTFSYGASWGGSVALAPIANYITAGNWYHIVGTVSGNGGAAYMYINGSLAGSGTAGTPTTTDGLNIGLGNGGSFYGDMPLFRMYSETLSAAQVQQNYLAYKKRFGI